ncbi:hypothetical protein ACROYT_G044139 [Oculina patagonica]
MQSAYLSNGVPKLSLANPRAQVVFPTGQYTYAFGNTPGVGLTDNFGTSTSDESLEFLLLGSGDVRNLLFTIFELSQRPRDIIPANLSFVLNDHDPSVIARNVIILETVRSIDPDRDLDVDFLWNLWYNLTLSNDELKRLQAILQNLTLPQYVNTGLQFGSKEMFTECLQIWKDWLSLEINVEAVSSQRQNLMVFGLNLTQQEIQDKRQENIDFLTAVTSLTNTTIKQLFTPFDEQKLDRKCLQQSGLFYQEVYSYFLTGCTSEVHTNSKVNPTLIRPFEHKWKVHYGSCPFSGFIPIDRNRLQNNKSITKTCKEKLKRLVKTFQSFAGFETENPRLKVTFWSGDALELCRIGLPKEVLFDVIDTSNLSDHIGLLNILVCCGNRLKEPGQSQMFTSTMLWRASGFSRLEEYLESSLGIGQSLFPAVLGMKLAEDLDLGRSDILTVKESRRIEDRMVWVKTEPERSPITFVRSPDVLAALKSMAARCFRLPSPDKRCLQLSGVTLSSPTTFFLVFLQMAATFEESAEQVLSYVEECLPSVRLFQKRSCTKLNGLSWNVLKCLAGLCPGVVLKVEVRVTFPTRAVSRNTPVMQAVMFEDPNDARFLKVWPASQLEQRTFHRPVHLFYNNVRYDPDQGTVSLLLLETDWQALHDETVLILISSSANYTSNAVKLKTGCKTSTNNETVKMASKNDREMVEQLRSKRRKSRLSKNLSCVRMSCVSNHTSSGLQKYDSCYRLEILSSRDIIMQNSGHVHRSTDCLVMEERHTIAPMRLFPSGIDAPSYQDDVVQGKKIADDVIIHNGSHAIEDDGDSKDATTTVEKGDDVTQLFGLRDVTVVTRHNAKTNHLELLALEEHAMCYNADILILRTANIADPTVEYHPKEMPTSVEIKLRSEGKPLKLYFSAPVDEKTSKVQILKDKKKLRCHFPKSELGVFGQACIKRPPVMDFSTLPRWTCKEDLNFLMVYNDIDEDQTAPQNVTAFEELQNVLQCIIASFVEYPQNNKCFTIHEPCGKKENAPNFTIVVQEIYCHKQVPLAKILFCDHSVTAFPLKGNKNSASAAGYKEVLRQMMADRKESPMAHVTKKGQVLLRRLLYSNAKRVKQTKTQNPVWIDSMLQLRFQEENTEYEIQD